MTELMSEFRALRANVLRRWRDANVDDPATAIEEVVRFDEAIDQALTESIAWYASQTDRSRELMSGMIAHDLRNPLGAIVMSAHYLLRSDAIAGPEMKAAGRILSSATTMKKLVGDLLDFTQVRMGGHLAMTPVNMSLRDVCLDAVEELKAFHPDRTIEVTQSESVDGYWDRDRLHQVISNLVANALGHGAADAPVTVSAALEGACARLDVHNLGEPIPAESLSEIFDPLKRVPQTGARAHPSTGGVGLGLFIVKEVARAHGGSVAVASSREAGTTFTVKLPRKSSACAQQRDL
ncbi:GHKL domain protein [Caballeronia fortuita]|uniref:histidine kinase n=2 Tax=Caballeronia fortuita TaxID=1777138 RepID=A0A158CAG2_9BURK|nr:GHKL domain protein [Caballeronia fortuita]